MSIVVVQTTSVPNSGLGFNGQFNAITATLSGVTSGNAIIAQGTATNNSGGGGTLSATDTTTSTNLNSDISTVYSGAVNVFVGSEYAVASGTHAIQFTQSAATSANCYGGPLASEVSGLVTNGFDQSASGTGNSTGPITTAATGALAQASELLVGVVCGYDLTNAITHPPTGGPGTFTELSFSNSTLGCWELAYQIQTTGTSAVTVSWGTSGTSGKWNCCVGTYKGFVVSGYSLSASYGPFSIAGQAATLSANTSIPALLAACGTYNISLASASSDFDLISAFGSYAYVGKAASLVPVYAAQYLVAAFGAYSIAAQNALLVFAQPTPTPAGPNIIPLMVGIFYEQAVYLLEQLNIYSAPTIFSMSQTPTVTVNFIASNQIPGIVLAQSLATGTPAPLGTPVTLTVSEYPMAQDVIP